MLYGINLPPLHQYSVAKDAIGLSLTSTEVTESGVYLFSSGHGSGIFVRITAASDATEPTASNGFILTPNATLALYVEAGQFIHASNTNGSYTLLRHT